MISRKGVELAYLDEIGVSPAQFLVTQCKNVSLHFGYFLSVRAIAGPEVHDGGHPGVYPPDEISSRSRHADSTLCYAVCTAPTLTRAAAFTWT